MGDGVRVDEKFIFREKNGCLKAPPPRDKRPGRLEPKNLVIRGTPIYLKKIIRGTPIFFPEKKLFCRKILKIAN